MSETKIREMTLKEIKSVTINFKDPNKEPFTIVAPTDIIFHEPKPLDYLARIFSKTVSSTIYFIEYPDQGKDLKELADKLANLPDKKESSNV